MVRKIIWSQRSQIDRKEIFDYWNNRNKSKAYSIKLRRLIKEASLKLADNPFLGSLVRNHSYIRKKVVGDYLIVYEFDDQKIVILSIFDTRQHPDKLNNNIK